MVAEGFSRCGAESGERLRRSVSERLITNQLGGFRGVVDPPARAIGQARPLTTARTRPANQRIWQWGPVEKKVVNCEKKKYIEY